MAIVTVLAVQTVMAIVTLLAIETVMAIMTVLAIETDIYGYRDRPGYRNRHGYYDRWPRNRHSWLSNARISFQGSLRGTVHVSLITAEVAKTVTSLLRYLCSSLA